MQKNKQFIQILCVYMKVIKILMDDIIANLTSQVADTDRNQSLP